jgi:hypothetical protein
MSAMPSARAPPPSTPPCQPSPPPAWASPTASVCWPTEPAWPARGTPSACSRPRGQYGPGDDARFDTPTGITMDPAGNVVVVDYRNHALRLVSKAGAVSTLAGGGGAGFADGQGAAARFNLPISVVVTANGDYVMTDFGNHELRVVTPGGAVRTVAGNGERGFVDVQGAAARFNRPVGLALDVDDSRRERSGDRLGQPRGAAGDDGGGGEQGGGQRAGRE